jgi:uncharacterized membrane protein YccF (DUF307 family)
MIVNKFGFSLFYIHPIFYGLVQALLFVIIGIPFSELAFRFIEIPFMSIGEFVIKKLN